jgi:hypothetical protein
MSAYVELLHKYQLDDLISPTPVKLGLQTEEILFASFIDTIKQTLEVMIRQECSMKTYSVEFSARRLFEQTFNTDALVNVHR